MKKLFATKEVREYEARKARAEMRAERSLRAFERQAKAIDELTAVFRGAAREVQEMVKPLRVPLRGSKFKR
jgi:hypothetical protein